MTREELKEKAADLPLAPGVYLMMDKTGKVIYVGKANWQLRILRILNIFIAIMLIIRKPQTC